MINCQKIQGHLFFRKDRKAKAAAKVNAATSTQSQEQQQQQQQQQSNNTNNQQQQGHNNNNQQQQSNQPSNSTSNSIDATNNGSSTQTADVATISCVSPPPAYETLAPSTVFNLLPVTGTRPEVSSDQSITTASPNHVTLTDLPEPPGYIDLYPTK